MNTVITEDKLMDKIQKLLDKAMGTDNPNEADTFMRKAEALMLQHSIDQMQLDMRSKNKGSVKGEEPVVRSMFVFTTDNFPGEDWEVKADFTRVLDTMWRNVMRHFNCIPTNRDSGCEAGHKEVVGYPSDLDFAEMLWVGLKMHMATSLNPRYDKNLDWQHNLANFKDVGLKWDQIHTRLQEAEDYPLRGMRLTKENGRSKLPSAYNRVCKAEGRDKVQVSNPRHWRFDFMFAYVHEIRRRLDEGRKAATEGTNLPALIVDRFDLVQELLYDTYPELRPHPWDCKCDRCLRNKTAVVRSGRKARYSERKFNASAHSAGRRTAASADISGRGSRMNTGSKGAIES